MHDSAKIRREIARLYDRNPEGWRVLVGKDHSGFYDALISRGTDAWQVKEYQVNPYKFVGLGSRLPQITNSPLVPQEHPFGLRPIAVEQMKEFASIVDDPKTMNEIAARMLSTKPVSASEALESPAILQGPILQSARPLDSLSSAHTKLDEKLRKELRQLVNREFRHTVTPYI